MTPTDGPSRIDGVIPDSEKPLSVSSDAFRSAMRRWPSGVTIVTIVEGVRGHGMTASAFTSVSVDPPLVLVVIDKRWRSHALIESSGSFCVNILADDQRELSDRFAGRHGEIEDRFFDLDTGVATTGARYISDANAWLDCIVEQTAVAGDHSIFIGRVVACSVTAGSSGPLIYHDGDYRRLAGAGLPD